MTTIEKFLNENWEIDEEVEGVETWKHIHEFTHRFDSIDPACEGDHSTSILILESMGYTEDEIAEMVEWFKENGGFCDCEVMMNAIRRYYPAG